MLLHDQLRVLQAVRDNPAVTVLWTVPAAGSPSPLDPLLVEVADRLRLEVDDEEVAARLEDLRRLAGEVADDRGQRAVALFACRSHRAASRLPEPVRDRVVVDETFATRDVVRAVHRSPEYLVLLLTEPDARLYEGRGRIHREVVTGGFPFTAATLDGIGRDRRHDPGVSRDRHLDDLTRAVDRCLSDSGHDDWPIVAVGGRERLAKYAARSRHQSRIIGTVAHGRTDRAGPGRLGDLVWPVIEDWLADQAETAMHEIDRAIGAKRLSAGIDEVWPLAQEGRGRLLVVEQSFEYPAYLAPDGEVLEPADDPAAPGVLDDAVDEVIEHVLVHDGRVTFVPDGALADRGRVALTLRY